MQIKEAIEFLSRWLDNEHYTNKCNKAHQIAISALEKQIPKKVIKNEGYWEINCPYCLTDIAEEKGNEYCVICGQALDWSEP